jgi:excinuclease UvrABC nuclease subunit
MLAQYVNLELVKKLKFSAFKRDSPHFGGGVYRMYDEAERIVYVGKSQDLQRRITSHLNKTTNTKYFINTIKHIDCHKNDSPIMQMLLESILIALYRPKYNDEVKDEKALERTKRKKT